jgi:hypothetical protein
MKGEIVIYFEAVSRNVCGGTEENYQESLSGYLIFWQISEPVISEYEAGVINISSHG